MFHGGRSSVELAQGCVAFAKSLPDVDVVVAPPFTALAAVAETVDGTPVKLAAQNLYPKDSGAFTGEVSAPFLKECGCAFVIVGHSERRQYFAETDAFVAEKAAAALAHDLLPIVCVGETLAQREAGETLRIVKQQVDAFLDVLARTQHAAAIAYEPVWAIGTGKNATPAQASEVHGRIRAWCRDARVRILYGGSVKPENVDSLAKEREIDGVLVGGASLDPASFARLVSAFKS
jgi:triosephosphate isomerase